MLRLQPWCLSVSIALGLVTQAQPDKLQFNRDIRPILSDNCFRCHGPDKANRKAKLRLDQREVALERGAIVPGKTAESKLVTHIFSHDPEEIMPPPDSHKQLTAAQKEVLKRWIAEGAEYQPHWAYIKPVRPSVPAVKDTAWVRTPIDAFILRELETRNVKPSPEADKHALLRRLSLDLTGLPPTPEDLKRAGDGPVERLLASPHYGERMAVPWLDTVRFADTVGYHGDQNQNIFPYRDYVINSFNRNKPFDRFTIEQLAGDLLEDATDEQKTASGFNRLNMMTREGGAQPKEYLAKYAADRVRTVATTWLGSTLACAECHDHKYDPFSTKDFYELEAFFADVRQWGVYNDYTYTPNPDLAGWSNDHPFPPEIEVNSPYLQARKERFRARIRELMDGQIDPAALAAWRESAGEFLGEHPDGWLTPEPVLANKTNAFVTDESVIVFENKRGPTNEVRLTPGAGTWGAVRLDLVPHSSHDGKILRAKSENKPMQVSARVKAAGGGKSQKIDIYFAEATQKERTYANGRENLGVKDGWKASSAHLKGRQTAIYVFDRPVKLEAEDTLIVTVRSSAIGAARISVSPFAAPDPLLLLLAPELITHNETERHVADMFVMSTDQFPDLARERKRLQRELLECRNGRAPTLVTVSQKAALTRVLPRGNWQDESGEIVEPAVPHFLPQPVGGGTMNRLDLANWLVSPENPLTARTFVNRLWKQFFGAGLCNTVDDLGFQGDAPSHPDLLDWLAVEFQESGWDIKHMVRLIVNSSTYRQQSQLRPEWRETDPANRLLASQNPRRLEAEFVRDNALVISGLLDDDLGGPSVHPLQPAGYYANLQFPDRDYVADKDERQYRRGVYVHWQRTFLHPMLANFDASSREECTAARIVSNTPQQALTLLNDPSFVEAARAFADRLKGSDSDRIDTAYQYALARLPKPAEKQSLLQFLAEQRKTLNESDAWTSLCRVILNLHETITIY